MNDTTTMSASTAGKTTPPASPSQTPSPSIKTTTNKPTPPRSRPEALRGVDYLARLDVVHQRLYSRLDKGLKLVQVFGGSAAFGAATSGQVALMTGAGMVIALAACISLVVDFGLLAQRHSVRISRCNAITLQALNTPEMTAAEIDAARTRASDMDINVIEALRRPCFNDMLRTHGLTDHLLPLTLWQRFWAALA